MAVNPLDEIHELVDLNAINTQDLLFGEPTHTLSDLEGILGLGHDHVGHDASAHDEPVHWKSFPTLDPVQTDYDFDIHIDTAGEKLNWMYSAKLDKVYIKLNSTMNMTVSYVPNGAEPLHVRAMIVFSRRDEVHMPVTRCPNHRMLSSEVPVFHILKCCNMGTHYYGIENESSFGRRSSLVVPLGLSQPAPNELGRCQQSLGLEFLCQNSCANGIQRKQTVLVFTLENDRRQILGKRVMHFKVCSCPKRDMSKEMSTPTAPPQRKRSANGPPSASAGGKHLSKMVCLTPPPQHHQQHQLQLKQETTMMTTTTAAAAAAGNESSPVLSDNGTDGEYIGALTAGIDNVSFKFDTSMTSSSSPDTMPMSSPTESATSASTMPMTEHQQPGGYAVSITMPSLESAQHVLRCAYNEVTGSMARDKSNSTKYIPYARQLEQFASDNNMPL